MPIYREDINGLSVNLSQVCTFRTFDNPDGGYWVQVHMSNGRVVDFEFTGKNAGPEHDVLISELRRTD